MGFSLLGAQSNSSCPKHYEALLQCNVKQLPCSTSEVAALITYAIRNHWILRYNFVLLPEKNK